jgi:NADH-quinone oxidoreductase subunit M
VSFPILSLLILLPAVGAVAVAAVPSRRSELLLPVAVAVSLLPVAAAGYLLTVFEVTGPDTSLTATEGIVEGFQFTERVLWFEPWDVSWNVGVDGISLLLVVLTTILFPISLLASKSITHRAKSYFVSMLILETGLIGVFLALDLLLFFVFFEIVLVPMYLLIGIWGSENRRYAAIKFVLYTALGSAFMLAGIISLALLHNSQVGGLSFDFANLLDLDISRSTQTWMFLAFAIAFAIKVPLFPLHTWLPDAHTEAPTAGSVLLAGVLLKLGTYGFLRFNLTLFPDASVRLAPWVAGIAVVGIIYGAVVAIVQPDVKRLVAYSSVSHLGFIVLGIFALTSQGLQGGVIQMINHGLTTGALFLLVGMLYDRRHTRMISDYGGLASVMPIYAGFFLFAVFASVGLPGLNGFIGEFKVLIGSYLTLPGHAIIAAFGVVLAAIYLLWAYERMFTGSIDVPENQGLKDLDLREVALLVPVAVLIVYLGVYPKPALDRIEPSVEVVIGRIVEVTDHEIPDFGRLAEFAQREN